MDFKGPSLDPYLSSLDRNIAIKNTVLIRAAEEAGDVDYGHDLKMLLDKGVRIVNVSKNNEGKEVLIVARDK